MGVARTTAAVAASLLTGAAATGVARTALRVRRTVPAELRHPQLLLPLPLTSPRMLPAARAVASAPAPLAPGVALRTVQVPVPGAPPAEVFVYDTAGRRRPSGALLYLHGGGTVMGHPAAYHDVCSRIAAELGVLVASVRYRLAPEHPFPAALDDAHAALLRLHDRADVLGVDPRRVAVGGDSAGGLLAASLAQRAHDEGVPVRFQLLVYPALDDRTVLREDDGTGRFLWTRPSNRFMWTSYLGHAPGGAEERPYAVPARRAGVAGLPPAWIGVGDLDLFLAEDVAYAGRLAAAGVPCALEVVPGMYHGADRLVGDRSATVRRFRAAMCTALRDAIGG